MGFCHRCGEITVGKCNKCGGRSVESTISCLVSEGGVSIVDRWQSQYADTILAPEEIIRKSPTSKRIPVSQSTFYKSMKRLCTCCSKILENGSNYSVEDNASYCKECHLKLFNKGKCPTCLKLVSDKHDFIEYTKKTWHADCFVCFKCKASLDADPLIDLQERPCCESCFMSQAGKPRYAKKTSRLPSSHKPTINIKNFDLSTSQPSTSTKGSISSESSSFYKRASLSSRPRIDNDLFNTSPTTTTPPLTRTPSPDYKESDEDDQLQDLLSRRQRNQNRLTSMFIPPTSSQSSPVVKNHPNIISKPKVQFQNIQPSSSMDSIPISPKTTKSSLSKRPCHYCHQPLGDATRKKVKIPLGPQTYAWFHKSCFLCSKCHMPFRDGECTTDGQTFYHAQCDRLCGGCQKPILKDAFQFNQRMYHFDCFKCAANGCVIAMGQPVFEVNGKPYCQSCHTLTMIPPSSPVSRAPPEENDDDVLLKKLMAGRQRVLPKLGGSKTCPRCRKSISIMDDTEGPLTSRWHKKCLRCAKCSKQLDSDAKTRQGSLGESLVYCRNCIV